MHDMLFYNKVIGELKALEFTSRYEKDEDGNFIVSVKEFELPFGCGPTRAQARRDLVKSMRQWGDVLRANLFDWEIGRDEQLPYLLKIFVSSDAELLSCLN